MVELRVEGAIEALDEKFFGVPAALIPIPLPYICGFSLTTSDEAAGAAAAFLGLK